MKKISFFIATIVIVLSILNITTYAASDNNISYVNLVGENRYKSSILVSKNAYPKGAKNVILVNSSSSTDGIVAETLAKKLDAPILLTEKNKIRAEIKTEINRLSPTNVYLIGGTDVISKSVENELKNMNKSIQRVSGKNRYITAIEVAKKINSFDKVIICNSNDNGNNASAIATVAAQNQIPILYSDGKNKINSNTYNFIQQNSSKIKTIYMIGNGASNSQKNSIKKAGIALETVNGNTPYDINVNMINKFNNKYNKVVLVNNSIDAISVSYLAAKNKALLLFTGTDLTNEQKNILKKYDISTIYYSGGGKIKGTLKETANILKNEETSTSEIKLNKSKVVFYVPHQDDESVFFSQTILKAIKEKGAENVYVVMITDGATSVVAKNTSIQKQLKKYGITFTQARDNEYYAACKALGLKESNILFNENLGLTRLKDGSVKADSVKSTMLYFEEKFAGDVTHLTYTFKYDTHNDHKQLGTALNSLYYDLSLPEESFNSVYFIIRSDYNVKNENSDNIKMFTLKEINYSDRIINALKKYKETNNSNNKKEIRLGIGYKSVGKTIDTVIKNVENKKIVTNIHLPY